MRQRYRTGDQIWVRERNLAIVLNYLWEAGRPVSRSHLVQVSGLNKSTVGSLLAQLQSWGFVRESGMSEPRPGRPGVLVEVNPDAGRLIGMEIGVGFISAVATDLKAKVVWRHKLDTVACERLAPTESQARVLEQAEELLQDAIRATTSEHRLFGIGVGVPGLVDHTTGTLLFAPNLKWTDVPLRDMWRRRFGVPVVVENEANASALGERMLGVAKQIDDFVYLSAGVGLGGGLMMNGKLYGGKGGFAGEIGHTTLCVDGPPCNCGNRGCWEVLIGPTAILQRVRQASVANRASRLMKLPEVDGNLDAIRMEHVVQAAMVGEQAVLNVLNDVGQYLGIGIANVVNTFNPGLVVLGGALSLAGPFLLPRAQQEVNRRALAVAQQGVQIVLSAFKFDACVMGGAALILREILNNPTGWRPQPSQDPVEVNVAMATSAL